LASISRSACRSWPDVVHLGSGVGLHLCPLAAGIGSRLIRLLLCAMGGLIEVVLRLVESSLELVTGLGGGRLDCLPRLGHTRLEYVESCREIHVSSLDNADRASPRRSPGDTKESPVLAFRSNALGHRNELRRCSPRTIRSDASPRTIE
jgi:hypothetical protein